MGDGALELLVLHLYLTCELAHVVGGYGHLELVAVGLDVGYLCAAFEGNVACGDFVGLGAWHIERYGDALVACLDFLDVEVGRGNLDVHVGRLALRAALEGLLGDGDLPCGVGGGDVRLEDGAAGEPEGEGGACRADFSDLHLLEGATKGDVAGGDVLFELGAVYGERNGVIVAVATHGLRVGREQAVLEVGLYDREGVQAVEEDVVEVGVVYGGIGIREGEGNGVVLVLEAGDLRLARLRFGRLVPIFGYGFESIDNVYVFFLDVGKLHCFGLLGVLVPLCVEFDVVLAVGIVGELDFLVLLDASVVVEVVGAGEVAIEFRSRWEYAILRVGLFALCGLVLCGGPANEDVSLASVGLGKREFRLSGNYFAIDGLCQLSAVHHRVLGVVVALVVGFGLVVPLRIEPDLLALIGKVDELDLAAIQRAGKVVLEDDARREQMIRRVGCGIFGFVVEGGPAEERVSLALSGLGQRERRFVGCDFAVDGAFQVAFVQYGELDGLPLGLVSNQALVDVALFAFFGVLLVELLTLTRLAFLLLLLGLVVGGLGIVFLLFGGRLLGIGIVSLCVRLFRRAVCGRVFLNVRQVFFFHGLAFVIVSAGSSRVVGFGI